MAGCESNVPATWQTSLKRKKRVKEKLIWPQLCHHEERGRRLDATQKAIIDLPVEWCWRIAEGWAWLCEVPDLEIYAFGLEGGTDIVEPWTCPSTRSRF